MASRAEKDLKVLLDQVSAWADRLEMADHEPELSHVADAVVEEMREADETYRPTVFGVG